MIEQLVMVALGVATLLYVWCKRHYSYWSRLGVAQTPALPLVGNMLPALLNTTSVGLIYDQIYRKYAEREAVGVYSLLTPKLLLRSPHLIQRVLVSDFSSFHDNEFIVSKELDPHFALDPFCLRGEEWKPARTKLNTTMTAGKLKDIFPIMKEIIPRLDSYLGGLLGKDIEAKELSTLFMMDNVSNCVFGVTGDCLTDPEAVFRKMADTQMKDVLQSWWRTLIVHLMPTLQSLLRLRFVPTSVNDFIERVVTDVFEHRSKSGISRNDLFQVFMKKSKEAEDPWLDMFFFGSTFFIEGFETSAMTASGALYELALHPRVQESLHEELRRVLGDSYDPDLDTLNSLSYLDCVIQESQRKYPIMYTLTKVCTKSTSLDIDGRSVNIDPGTPVVVPVFSIQQDPRFFPDPHLFDPERFNEENKASRPACSFLPFGDGPRICPGIKFGLAQVKLLLSYIVYKYKIVKCDRTPASLTFASGSFLLVPNESRWVRLEKRC